MLLTVLFQYILGIYIQPTVQLVTDNLFKTHNLITWYTHLLWSPAILPRWLIGLIDHINFQILSQNGTTLVFWPIKGKTDKSRFYWFIVTFVNGIKVYMQLLLFQNFEAKTLVISMKNRHFLFYRLKPDIDNRNRCGLFQSDYRTWKCRG